MKFRSILDLLANDKIENALTVFEFFFDHLGEKKNDILLIQANYNSLKNQENLNLLDASSIAIEKNKIRKAILEIFSQIETLTEEEPGDPKDSNKGLINKSQAVRKTIQDAVIGKGYEIISQIHSDQSSYYFKAKRNSFVQKDYYVIQVLNWYKLNNSNSGYNQAYLDFFSRCPHPFVDLIEFHPGNPSYIIRKYAQGIDLSSLLTRGINLSLIKALDVIVSISKGLTELQSVQIFYNNLIPDQIILDTSWDLYLLPLNIFEENDSITTWKNLKDGIKFMSPEQLALAGNKSEQNKLTINSNQFSLGLLLFYIIMGEPLFDGEGLPSLYEDRINHADTKTQLISFYETFHKRLLQLEIEEELAKELLAEFVKIYETLIENNSENRHAQFGEFISQLEFLKLKIEREKKSKEAQPLYHIANSIYRSIVANDNLIEELYQLLKTQLPFKKSIEDEENRNISLLYSLKYLFDSVSNFDQASHIEEGLSCLVKNLHFDFTIEDYEVFFALLKDKISTNDTDWNAKIDTFWKSFTSHSLDAIDTILNPKDQLFNS